MSLNVPEAEAWVTRVDDWAGADHFEDCPALRHTDGECDCPEDGCPDPDEGCDCYLGVMRGLQASLRKALALAAAREQPTQEKPEGTDAE
jgi:hypothetical protein